MPNSTFAPEDHHDAHDEPTKARLRAAVRTYAPEGVMAIGRVLGS